MLAEEGRDVQVRPAGRRGTASARAGGGRRGPRRANGLRDRLGLEDVTCGARVVQETRGQNGNPHFVIQRLLKFWKKFK